MLEVICDSYMDPFFEVEHIVNGVHHKDRFCSIVDGEMDSSVGCDLEGVLFCR